MHITPTSLRSPVQNLARTRPSAGKAEQAGGGDQVELSPSQQKRRRIGYGLMIAAVPVGVLAGVGSGLLGLELAGLFVGVGTTAASYLTGLGLVESVEGGSGSSSEASWVANPANPASPLFPF